MRWNRILNWAVYARTNWAPLLRHQVASALRPAYAHRPNHPYTLHWLDGSICVEILPVSYAFFGNGLIRLRERGFIFSTSADNAFTNRKRFPTLTVFSPVGQGLTSKAVGQFMRRYHWRTVTVFCDVLSLYPSIATMYTIACRGFQSSFQEKSGEFDLYYESFDSFADPNYEGMLRRAKSQSRSKRSVMKFRWFHSFHLFYLHPWEPRNKTSPFARCPVVAKKILWLYSELLWPLQQTGDDCGSFLPLGYGQRSCTKRWFTERVLLLVLKQ